MILEPAFQGVTAFFLNFPHIPYLLDTLGEEKVPSSPMRFNPTKDTFCHAIIPVAVFAFLAALPCRASTVDIGKGDRIYFTVESYKGLRDKYVVKQVYDYSCGAAALATLLSYGLGDFVSERDILDQVMATLAEADVDMRKKKGLSLLDLQKVSMARGHKAMGFRLDPVYLSRLERPVMVYIEPRGYEHFAVLKGVKGNNVYLADPSLGNVRMPLYRFLDIWQGKNGKGIIFLVERTDGNWPESSPLALPEKVHRNPSVIATRYLLEQSSRFPQLIQPILLK